MAVELNLILRELEIAAVGDADLFENQINIGDHFSHRVLDLNACVHLYEVERAIVVQEFDRADAQIFDLAHGAGDGLADFVACRRIQGGRGAFFPDFLMTALQRAVAFAEMNGAALAIAEHLDFDVARPFEVFFQIESVVAEGGF